MTLKRRLLRRILPPTMAWFLRMLLATVRVRELGNAGCLPGLRGRRRLIFAFWHDEIVPVVGYYAGRDIQSMASRSFDGEVIADTLVRLGYPAPTRGSSSNNGRQALKALARGRREGRGVVLTPDGPMGPRHRVQPGVLTLARLTGYQLSATGVSLPPLDQAGRVGPDGDPPAVRQGLRNLRRSNHGAATVQRGKDGGFARPVGRHTTGD